MIDHGRVQCSLLPYSLILVAKKWLSVFVVLSPLFRKMVYNYNFAMSKDDISTIKQECHFGLDLIQYHRPLWQNLWIDVVLSFTWCQYVKPQS
jgi:hypothetical protein